MTIINLVNQYTTAQIVLSFSNNNDVLITEDCINPNSKFYRRSKVRLGCEFELSGCIKNHEFHKNTTSCLEDCEALIYRTYRGKDKSDYILYVYLGDYKLLESYKKVVSYKRVMKECQQLTMNSITKPDPDGVLDLRPVVISEHECKCLFRSKRFVDCEVYSSKVYTHGMEEQYGYYYAVLAGLQTALKYPDKINHVRILCPSYYKLAGIYQFPLKKWIPRNQYTQSYLNRMLEIRERLQEQHISISFVIDKKKAIA